MRKKRHDSIRKNKGLGKYSKAVSDEAKRILDTYNDIALVLGYASESTVVKRKGKITKELRKRYLELKSQPEPLVFLGVKKQHKWGSL